MTEECKDGLCPVREVLGKYGGGGGADDTTRLVIRGGVKPCCDIVIDNARFLATVDALKIAHGRDHTTESFTELVTRYMQPTCRTTARLLDRALNAIGGNVDLKTSMSISALQHNLDIIAQASGKEAPKLTVPPLPMDIDTNVDTENIQKRIKTAHEYADAIERQHIVACQWLADFAK
jgi:hypothetical protein